jgi:hypothetical protein
LGPARQAAQVKAISRGEILLRLIVWHIRPKFQGKNGAAAMILCAGEALTEAGSILNLNKVFVLTTTVIVLENEYSSLI